MSGVGTAIAIGTVAAAGIGAGASVLASSKQSSAAKQAAQIQESDQQRALDVQQQEWQQQQANEAPFLKAGTKGINTLSQLTSTPGKGLLSPYGQTFTAPNPADVSSEPGYQFQEQQGQLEQAAAATGNVFSGNTLTAASKYNTGLAGTYYNDAYNRALNTYNTNYNVWSNNQANEYNRLANMAGLGQTTAAQLGSEGQAVAGNTANIDLTSGARIGQDITNLGTAQASGYVGAANALTGGVNSLSQYALLNSILNGNQASNLGQDWLNVPQVPLTPTDLGMGA